jgi:hypothetical protein
MTTELLFQESFLDILLDDEMPLLHMNWKGYQSDVSIMTGSERLLELMQQKHVYKVLNDNTNSLGIWLGMVNWLVFNFRPRVMAAGLQCCAHVYGPSRLSRISAEAAEALLGPYTRQIKGFSTVEEAKAWLRDFS